MRVLAAGQRVPRVPVDRLFPWPADPVPDDAPTPVRAWLPAGVALHRPFRLNTGGPVPVETGPVLPIGLPRDCGGLLVSQVHLPCRAAVQLAELEQVPQIWPEPQTTVMQLHPEQAQCQVTDAPMISSPSSRA